MNKVRKIEFEGNYYLFTRLKQFTIIVTPVNSQCLCLRNKNMASKIIFVPLKVLILELQISLNVEFLKELPRFEWNFRLLIWFPLPPAHSKPVGMIKKSPISSKPKLRSSAELIVTFMPLHQGLIG